MYGAAAQIAAQLNTAETRPGKSKYKIREDGTIRWFTCMSKECGGVLWTDVKLKSHCFCCGRWGRRGQYY